MAPPLREKVLPLLSSWGEWWWGDGKLPRTRALAWAALGVRAVALIGALVLAERITHEVRTTRPPPALPAESIETGDSTDRFGLPLWSRKQIFFDLAAAEPDDRAHAEERFPDSPWSVEDYRAAQVRDRVRDIAAKRNLTVTQVYAILDEGIRGGWSGPGGTTLPGKVVPLQPRMR